MRTVKIRLQKFLSESGIASRRKAEELILEGKVKVNGHIAEIGSKVDPKRDKVTVRGKVVTANTEKVYIMLNKPRGYVTTMSDEFDRKSVADLVSPFGEEMIDSQVEIEGLDGECPIYNPEHIRGFFPEEGHEYLIKVRRYKLKNISGYYKYELIETIKDECL